VSGVVTIDAKGIPNSVTNAKITEIDLVVDDTEIGDPVAAATHAFTWDTGEQPGFAVGSHTINVTVTDANGRKDTVTQTVDLTQSTGPVLTAPTFAQGGNAQLGAVDIGGSATANHHPVHSVVVTAQSAFRDAVELDQLTAPAQFAPFSVEWDTKTGDFSPGTQTVTITATDSHGEMSVVTTTVPMRNPGLSFGDPSGPTIYGDERFEGTVTNNSPVVGMTVQVLRNGVDVGDPASLNNLAPNQTASFDIVIDVDDLPVSTGNGDPFAVVATDGTTRSVSLGRTLKVVRQAPTVTLTTPAANKVVGDTVHFKGTATNNSGTDGLTIVVKQDTTTIVSPTPLDIDAGATGNYDVSGPVTGLSDGPATFTVTVTDNKATPQSSTPVSRSLVVSHDPEVTLSTPIAEHDVFGAVHFTGTVTIHSPNPDVTVAVSTDGGAVSPASQSVPVSPHASANFDIVEDVDLVDAGDQTFTVTVTDADGLVATAQRDLVVSHPDPDLTVTSAPDPNTLVSSAAEFKGSATNNSGTDGLTLTLVVEGVTVQTVDLDIAAGATGNFDLTQGVGTLPVGSDVFDLVVTDINGLSTDDSRQLNVDHPPVVSVIAPTEGATVSGIVAVTGTVTTDGSPVDGDAAIHVSVDGGAPTDGTASGANFSVNVDLSALTGPHTITVTATDAAGVDSAAGVSRDVTVVAPAGLTVTEPVDNDPTPVTSGSLHFAGTITNNDPDNARTMTVHVTYGDTIDETFDVDPDVGGGRTAAWAHDVDVSSLPDGPDTFTITASYPFGGTSVPVHRTVTITNI
jgi:hypothetical protein